MSGCQIMSPRLKNPRDVLLSTTFCKLHLTLYWISTDCRKALCSSGQNPSLGQTNHYSQPRKIHTCPYKKYMEAFRCRKSIEKANGQK